MIAITLVLLILRGAYDVPIVIALGAGTAGQTAMTWSASNAPVHGGVVLAVFVTIIARQYWLMPLIGQLDASEGAKAWYATLHDITLGSAYAAVLAGYTLYWWARWPNWRNPALIPIVPSGSPRRRG